VLASSQGVLASEKELRTFGSGARVGLLKTPEPVVLRVKFFRRRIFSINVLPRAIAIGKVARPDNEPANMDAIEGAVFKAKSFLTRARRESSRPLGPNVGP